MKAHIKLLAVALLGLAVVGMPALSCAQDAPAAAKKEKKEKPANSNRAIPFRGKVTAIDKEAGTVTVGNRTFKTTPETKYLQGSLDTAKVGDEVGGSYRKADDGTLTLNSIRFGPKADKPNKARKEKKPADE